MNCGQAYISAAVGKPPRHRDQRMLRIIFLIALPPLLAVMQGGESLAQQAAQDKPLLAEQVFKNVQALKGIPVDDFIQTMGLMTAALQFDCSDCHVGAGTNRVDWAADTPRKVTARRMINMVATLNRNEFGGRQVVTCWTCHRNRDRPLTTPNLEIIYGTPSFDNDDAIPQNPGSPAAESILDKYIQASGGAQRLAGLTSFAGKGTSVGFGGYGGTVELLAKAPDKRATIILFDPSTGQGDQIRTYDGRTGWIRTPLNVLGEYQLNGSDLDGARFDAQISFPGQIKQILTNVKSGPPTTINNLPNRDAPPDPTSAQTHSVNVVQGNGPRGLLVTLYFDTQTGLLLREVRYGNSPIGRVPTMIEYGDYRDVDGIKFPFRITYAWLDGRDTIMLSEIKTNVPVDESKFERPAPVKQR